MKVRERVCMSGPWQKAIRAGLVVPKWKSVEHLTLTFRASEGCCPENESQLFSIFYEENSKASGLMHLHLGIRVAKKELPPGRWILMTSPGIKYLNKIWISLSGDSGLNWILGLKSKTKHPKFKMFSSLMNMDKQVNWDAQAWAYRDTPPMHCCWAFTL